MLILNPEEKIIIVIRKHWFVMARTAVIFVILLLIPSVVLTLLSVVSPPNVVPLESLINFGLSLYFLVLLVFLFMLWMDYYLDIWIITNERIIDVNQKGLFNRTISEIPVKNVQDVIIEVHGVLETLLKFGTLKIQTAGPTEFIINYAPNLYEAKNIILRYARAANSGSR